MEYRGTHSFEIVHVGFIQKKLEGTHEVTDEYKVPFCSEVKNGYVLVIGASQSQAVTLHVEQAHLYGGGGEGGVKLSIEKYLD